MGSPRPGPGRVLRLATRGSPLARHQADLVAAALLGAGVVEAAEPVVVHTEGDRRQDVALGEIGGRGVFAKEVQVAVLEGRADVAVHSAKDLPSADTPGLSVAAVLPRADPRDGLVGRGLRALAPGAVVATGSIRRRAQLANLRPDLTFVELRGNMATRLARVGDSAATRLARVGDSAATRLARVEDSAATRLARVGGDVAAVVVAMAAMERLGWSDRVTEILGTSVVLPQAGQGVVALECRVDDAETLAALDVINEETTLLCLRAERALVAALSGSCALPFGGLAEPISSGDGDPVAGTLRLQGLVATGDGRVIIRAGDEGHDPEALGRAVAERLLVDCGAAALDLFAVAPAVAGSVESARL